MSAISLTSCFDATPLPYCALPLLASSAVADWSELELWRKLLYPSMLVCVPRLRVPIEAVPRPRTSSCCSSRKLVGRVSTTTRCGRLHRAGKQRLGAEYDPAFQRRLGRRRGAQARGKTRGALETTAQKRCPRLSRPANYPSQASPGTLGSIISPRAMCRHVWACVVRYLQKRHFPRHLGLDHVRGACASECESQPARP